MTFPDNMVAGRSTPRGEVWLEEEEDQKESPVVHRGKMEETHGKRTPPLCPSVEHTE